jgi:hypothetical protein
MIIRRGSHRAHDKVASVLGYSPQGLYNMDYPGSYGLCEVTEEEFEKIKDIKMVKKTRIKREVLHECWKMS